MARRGADRVGLLLLGVLAGFVATFALVYLSVTRARDRVVEERVRVALGLPRRAFELEEVEPDGSLRILLRRVAFLDPAGDTIVSAPVARARLLATSLAGSGPILFDQAEVVSPYLRLAKDARGEWNALQIVAAEADGQPVGAGEAARGRPLVFRGLRIVDGRARIVTPADPPAAGPPARFASGARPEVVRSGGRWVSVHTLADLDATLGTVRVGGGGGWRVEIDRASARVTNPDTRIQALAGWFEDRGDGRIRFALETFRTPHSAFDGEGSLTTGGDAPAYDLRLRAHPLDFRDLAGMGLALPREGTAAFALDVRTLAPGRTRWTVTDARVAVLDSRASGRLTAVTSAGAEPVFTDTRLLLEPLRLRDLEALGFVEKSPFAGEVRGTLVSVDQLQGGRAGALRVDLTATLVPRAGGEAPASTLLARGDVRLGKAGVRFEGLRVEAEPLHLATLRPLLAGRDSLLRGTVRGGATLSGTLKDFRVEGGDLAYLVGGAPETRLRGVSGTVRLQPALRYQLEARADPLALRTLTELFPALPFRSATLAGPIKVSGSRERMEFDVELDGAAGALAARGSLRFGAVLGFDVAGRVEAFRPGAVLAARPPAEGPLSGTFSARGTVEDLRFGVDLRQGEGSFNLAGTVRRPGGGAAQLDVEGRVDNFNVGMLVGRPGLLPSPVSGPIRVSGGGRQPYRFELGLRGATGVLDVNGWYQPGTVPGYAVNGTIAGLDLSGLPGLGFLPRTRLTGALALEGRGTTPESFVGRVELRADAGSTVAGLPLQAGIARLSSDGAVLRVDTLLFAVRGARLEARGGLGITRPAPTPLTFALEAPDLQVVRALLPGADTLPDLSGAIAASGRVEGTLRAPVVAATGRARAFRYGKWAAGVLDFDAQGSRSGRDWTGQAKLEGADLQLGGQRLQALRADLNAVPGRITFGMGARRDDRTAMTAAGTLEMREGTARGAIFDDLTLQLAGTEWKLAERARLAWAAETGLQVENLLLRRTGPGGGHLQAEGTIPPRGEADFRLNALGIDLGELHAVFPMFPDAQGVMALEGTLDGPVDDPRLHLDARVDSLRFGGAVADSLHVVANYAAGRMQVAGGMRVGALQVLDATATVPMTLTLGGIVPGFSLTREGPLTGRIAADSLPLALVAAAFPRYVKDGEGTARGLIEVGGTPASPRVSGSAALDNGAITVLPLLARWHTMNGRLSLRGDTVRVDSLTARSGSQGRAFVNGIVRLDDSAHPALDLAVWLDDFQVADNPELAEVQANARLRLAGRLPAAEVTGTLEIEDGTIYLPDFGEEGERDILFEDVGAIGADTVRAPGGGAALLAALQPRNLEVEIGESVWLESPDARILIAGQLTVDRPPGSPRNLIFGDLEARRGTYTLQVGPIEREFEIAQGRVQFFGTPDLNPALDITAEHEVRGDDREQPLTVVVHLSGTLQNPRVELSSNTRPPLPESELASLLVFGRRSESLAGLPEELARGIFFEEALGALITNQLEAQLKRTGLVDYVRVRARNAAASAGGAASAFGLDFLGPVTIEAGKEVVSNVFLSLQVVDFLSDQPKLGAAVDWEVSRTLSLRAAYEPVRRDPLLRGQFDLDYQATVDVRARWEYGRPKVQADIGPRRRDPEQPEPGQPSTPTGEPAPPPPRDTPPRDDDEDDEE